MQAAAAGRHHPTASSKPSTTRRCSDTLARFEATGSPVVTDGEQRKPSFATYPVAGLDDPRAGRRRRSPSRTATPASCRVLTDGPVPLPDVRRPYLAAAQAPCDAPGQAGRDLGVGAQPALPGRRHRRLPARGVPRRPRRRGGGRHPRLRSTRARTASRSTSPRARLSLKLDPSGGLLDDFVDLNNRVLERFTAEERAADRRPHLPRRRPRLDPQRRRRLRGPAAGAVRLERRRTSTSQLAERARPRARAARSSREHLRPGQRVFVGVTDPIDPRVETPEQVRDRVLEAAQHIPVDPARARPTTAASRRSPTTPRPPGTPPSRRSRPGCRAPRSRQQLSVDRIAAQRRRDHALRRRPADGEGVLRARLRHLPVIFEDQNSAVFKFESLLVNLLETAEAHGLIDPGAVATQESGSRFQLSIWVDDADAVCAELAARGVTCSTAP